MAGIFSFLGNIFKPVVGLIDDLHTSDEEKMQIRKEMAKIENEFAGKILEYESKLMESRAKIVEAEVTGHSWMQMNWRPLTMLVFLMLVVLNSFGVLMTELADEFWVLLKIGLGGYVIGRSAEKIVPALMNKKQ